MRTEYENRHSEYEKMRATGQYVRGKVHDCSSTLNSEHELIESTSGSGRTVQVRRALCAVSVHSGAKDKNQRVRAPGPRSVVYGKVSEIYGFGSEKILIVCA